MIYGDYDADGITSVSVLKKIFKSNWIRNRRIHTK